MNQFTVGHANPVKPLSFKDAGRIANNFSMTARGLYYRDVDFIIQVTGKNTPIQFLTSFDDVDEKTWHEAERIVLRLKAEDFLDEPEMQVDFKSPSKRKILVRTDSHLFGTCLKTALSDAGYKVKPVRALPFMAARRRMFIGLKSA